ncbi:hypothetical protein [Mycolicibacterium celeriflavum]|uniref:Uncharacterized protein n=1 Tax=Mycolicibacterium celeriflavum TaxID=1249101 RepID=A0A1X0BU42_MYCCF|nr:hypothetical protein [Mycolicibacterium celeriflavum]MCV7239869.1 hypothetical protein [Mycolicibacterium celeriflavum]ORA47204.1 hypothetical protein BST21_13160 [Mycolicibacterium celeriflavum]BBY44287.1 hypothetical protein MCEL_25820 [Mycolicibacterium celeriflavum]
MLGLTVRLVLAMIAVAAAALTSAAIAPATPQGPCADVPFVGQCTPWRDSPRSASSNSRFDPTLPIIKSDPGNPQQPTDFG